MSPPPRVLVVDDVEAHRYVMGSWLRRAGFDVLEAATGAEALAKVDAEVDAVVLDVHLPDMTGFDVCAAIKGDPATAALPVVHVSATAIDARSKSQGLDGGAEAYLIEPLEAEEFVATVRRLARAGVARKRTDRLVEQLTALAESTVKVNAADSLTGLLCAATHGAAQMFGSAAFAAATLGDGRIARCAIGGPDSEPVGDGPATLTEVMWFGRANVVEVERVAPVWQSLLARAGAHAARWSVLPLRDARGLIGQIAVAVPADAADVTEVDHGLLRQLVATVQVALDNLRAYTAEHRIALTLQRALLPRALPVGPGLALEARYFASGEGVSVGGDFYDSFELENGQICAVIGDVQGHSVHAATVMAELRFSLRAYLGEGNSPGRALDLLDDLMRRNHPEETATVVLMVIEADRRSIRIANAGHLPPLLLTAGDATFLEAADPLLGVGWTSHEITPIELAGAATVVLITDGLIERRHEGIGDSLQSLRSTVLAAATSDPVELADALVERFASEAAYDDIALLVVALDPAQVLATRNQTTLPPVTA